MPAVHPYRTPELAAARPRRETVDPLRGAQALTKVFLAGWSVLRVAACSTRGLDAEGCAALLVVVAMARSLVNTWSRFS
jgi:hypothetical protein